MPKKHYGQVQLFVKAGKWEEVAIVKEYSFEIRQPFGTIKAGTLGAALGCINYRQIKGLVSKVPLDNDKYLISKAGFVSFRVIFTANVKFI